MELFVNILIGAALLFVVATLILGTMHMGGKSQESQQKSNKWMAWRVRGQFIAIALLLVGFYLKSRGAG